jgi:hypothetical protein
MSLCTVMYVMFESGININEGEYYKGNTVFGTLHTSELSLQVELSTRLTLVS